MKLKRKRDNWRGGAKGHRNRLTANRRRQKQERQREKWAASTERYIDVAPESAIDIPDPHALVRAMLEGRKTE
jgi:hypothetical protein